MSVKLSEGSLIAIMNGRTVDAPIVQVLGHRKIVGNESSDRYRLLISDGINVLSFAMLGTQLNEKVVSGELSNNTIIRINNHVTSLVNNAGKGKKRVMIILDLDIIAKGEVVGVKIGNPVILKDDSSSDSSSNTQPAAKPPTPKSTYGQQNHHPQTNGGSLLHSTTPIQKKIQASIPSSPGMSAATHPIASLSPYQNKWVIKARVTNKSSIRTWSNSKGEGKLFSVDLVDESGEIRATAFNEQCDAFYNMLEINKIYFIKGCRLKGANKKFTSIQNDYEMSFSNETQIVACNDEETSSIPTVSFNFLPISSLSNMTPDNIVDVIGVCKATNDVQNLIARTTQRELKKRDITLVDNSNTEVTLTLWGSQAEEFDGSQQPVVAIKGGRLSEFSGGKSISLLSSSLMRLNPDIPEAHKLRGWFDNVGSTQDSQNISKSAGTGGGGSSQFKLLSEIKVDNLGGGEKPDYFTCKAYVMLVRKEGILYQACATPECNKKVVDMCNGMFRCEKCAREFPNFKWRMILNANLGDATDNVWATCFQEVAEKLLGVTTDELAVLKSKDEPDEYDAVFQKAHFKCYNFRLRTKMETYMDEKRLRTSAVQADPVNYVEYNRRMLNEIKEALA